MSKFYEDAERLAAFQLVAVGCMFLFAVGMITVSELISHYKTQKRAK